MPCCGGNREKARTAPVQPAPRTGVASPDGATVMLRYTGTTGIGVRGPRSGRVYAFSGRDPEHAVDGRDAEGLMKLGFFRRVGQTRS
jgi:hypothetical protein